MKTITFNTSETTSETLKTSQNYRKQESTRNFCIFKSYHLKTPTNKEKKDI